MEYSGEVLFSEFGIRRIILRFFFERKDSAQYGSEIDPLMRILQRKDERGNVGNRKEISPQ